MTRYSCQIIVERRYTKSLSHTFCHVTYITHTFIPSSYAHIYYTHSHPPLPEFRSWKCASLGGRPGLPVPNKPYGFCGRKATLNIRVQELCESRGGRPWLPVLLSLMVSVDVTQHWTMHTHRSQFVPNMPTRHPRTLSSRSCSSPSDWCKKCKKSDISPILLWLGPFLPLSPPASILVSLFFAAP